MIKRVILYEYPFNERIRTYLRLETLFRRLSTLVAREEALDHHFALATIFEIMDVAARADLKSDVMKDLERQKQQLDAFRGNPSIAEGVLEGVIANIDRCFSALNAQSGKAGHSLTENEFLMSIRSRIGIPGGTCGFDLPAYHAWQHQPATERQKAVAGWATTLEPLADAVYLLLKLLRDSGTPQKVLAQNGQFQQSLPQGRSFQLLRLRMHEAESWIPEISGNRLIVSVRMMHHDETGRLRNANDDVPFELTLCS